MTASVGTSFAYHALSADGRSERGSVSAQNESDARARLLRQGMLPIRLTQRRQLRVGASKLPVADLAVGLRILADLLGAGLPMGRALEIFQEIAPDRWRPAIGPMREAVREGRSLASALVESPLVIPDLVVGMARAGEAGDGIADAMRRAARHAEAAATASAAVRGALAYPIVVATTGLASVGVMVGVVLPRFAVILADLGQALPPMTQFVLSSASLGRSLTLPLLGLTLLLAFALRGWKRSQQGRLALDRSLLALPLIGGLRWSAATSRLTAALAALIGSGVSIPHGLRLAAQAAGDSAVDDRVSRALERIRAGEGLATALGMERAATPLAIRLVRAGEESGRLVPMLEHVSEMERERVTRTVQTGVRALEPLLILTFAGLVGIVAMALLQAVYAVRPA